MKRLLIVEDEPGLVLTLTDRLGREGYSVESAQDGRAGLERALQEPFDLVLLDVMLPGQNGFDVLRDLRQHGIETPVIMLTARGQVVDKVVGLKLGADDYLTKPFEMMELVARIEARLRRSAPKDTVDAEAYRFGARAGRFPEGRSDARRTACSICRRASISCCATSSSTAARRSHATSCSITCGATTPCPTRARWTSTSRGCGRRSSPTRNTRSTSSPRTGSGYKFVG